MTITKNFKFEAAHLLSNYSGACGNLHGHSYTGTIIIEADDVKDMMLDYNIISNYISDNFDHALLVAQSAWRDPAEAELLSWAERNHKKYYIVPAGRPTAENLVEAIAHDILDLFYDNGSGYRASVRVELQETASSSVRFEC